ncbi:MAG TPA: hypothetical protein VFN64_06865 [Burkholderiaceae bacterium]|nr:hypothetical protein [Burkholderiaceae bacterium]
MDTSELFLVGLCSLLDSMMGRPMAEALDHLPLSPAAKSALLGDPNPMRTVLEAILAQEKGEWADADASAAAAGLSKTTLSQSYLGALRWARALTRAGSR